MNKYLIIGGGITGVLLGSLLHKKGIAFQGLERSKQIGKDFNFGQLRIHQDNTVGLLKDLCESIDWIKIDEQPRERKKGEWITSTNNYIDEELAFLGNPFYRPTESTAVVLDMIKNSVRDLFLMEKNVEKIDLNKRIVYCQNGSEYEFDHLAWCANLKSLTKIVQVTPKIAIKNQRKKDNSQGGIHLEMELNNPLISFSNSVIFPFRYKDYKLRAIGINDSKPLSAAESYKMHWLVFLERELAEDREEVAKIIRAMKRELQKEFPELKTAPLREKIVFQPKVETHSPSEAKSLELFPGVFYVGPEIQLTDTLVNSSPWDITLENCKRVENMLAQTTA